jgi:hypothetical protein
MRQITCKNGGKIVDPVELLYSQFKHVASKLFRKGKVIE